MENNRSFDKLIQQKLKDFQVGYKPADWDKFAAGELINADPDSSSFDKLLKDKIIQHKVPYQAAHWTSFEHRLDASLHDNYAEELDLFVQGALHQYSVGYDPNSWNILEQKMVERRQYLRRLMLTKSTEAAIIIFALFTFFRFFPSLQFNQSAPDNASVVINQPGLDPLIIPDISSSNTNSSSNPLKPLTSVTSTKRPAVAQATQPSTAQDLSIPKYPEGVVPLAGHIQPLNRDNPEPALISSVQFATLLPPTAATSLVPPALNLQKRLDRQPGMPDLASTALINQADIDLDKSLGDFRPFVVAYKPASRFRLGVFGGADLNIVKVAQFELTVQPHKKPFIGVATDFVAGGYNAGMDLTYQVGRVMLETGLQYTQVNYYNPKNYYQLIKEGLVIEKARYTNEANIIEMPVHIHYRLSKSPDRFNTSFFAGISANIVTKFTSEAFRTPSQANLRSNNLEAKSELEQEFALFQLAIRNRFSSTEMQNLFYFDAGFNFEYLLDDRNGLFMQLGYNQPLQNIGIGGNQDVISQLSSKLGVRMSF